MLIGAALAADNGSDVALLLLVAVFQTITVPVLGMIVGRAAYRTGHLETALVEGDHPHDDHPHDDHPHDDHPRGDHPRGDGARDPGGPS